MLTLKLSVRGLWRHRFRSIITLSAIGFGHFLMLVFMGLGEGGHQQMIEVGVRQGTVGHVVVQSDGYQEERAVELLVTDPEGVREAIEREVPDTEVVLRVFGGGLAKTANNAVGVMFAGVEPEGEREVSNLAERIVEGVYLGAGPEAVARAAKSEGELWCARQPEGEAPSRPQAVIGHQLAQTLHIGLCDKLILDVQGLGEMEAAQFRVVGIFKTGNTDLDSAFMHLPLETVQHLLHVDGGVHQVAAFGASSATSHQLAEKIRGAVEGRPNLAVLPWDRALPELAEFIWLDDASMYVFLIIIFLIVGIGVLNTLLMSVMERTREFSVMRALGAGPGRIVRIVIMEAGAVGGLGVLLGLALALPVNHYLSTTGLDLSAFAESGSLEGAGVALTGVMRSALPLSYAVGGTLAVVGMALVSAIYPAVRAARVPILKAIGNV